MRQKKIIALMAGMVLAMSATAQQSPPHLPMQAAQQLPMQTGPQTVRMDVVVRAKSGGPVSGLQPADFTLLDNRERVPVMGFHELVREPVSVVLVLDGVNMDMTMTNWARMKMVDYLRSNEGRIGQQTTIGYFTNDGIEDVMKFSSNGVALADALAKADLNMRTIVRSTGVDGDWERADMSVKALRLLVARLAAVPGRKVIVWVSPGWPLLEAPDLQLQVDAKMKQEIYGNVVSVLTAMRAEHIRLYNINPLGAAQSEYEALRYEEFLGGLANPDHAEVGNLGLQVLALQSGGAVLDEGNDLGAMLAKCYAGTLDFYQIGFTALAGDNASYHKLQLKLDRKGLAVEAMQGYYTQP